MWPFSKKNISQRRLEIRKNVPEAPSLISRMFHKPGAGGSFTIAVFFFVFAAALGVWPADPLPYRQGQYLASDITAREDFRVLAVQLLEEAIRNARSSTPATFQLNERLLEDIIAQLEKMPAKLQAAKTLADVPPVLRQDLDLTVQQANAEQTAGPVQGATTQPTTQPAENVPATPSQRAYEAWVSLARPEERAQLEADLRQLRENLIGCYVVQADQTDMQQSRTARNVLLVRGVDQPVQRKVVDLVGQNEIERLKEIIARAARPFDSEIRPGVENFLFNQLSTQPMYTYDATRTEQDIKAAVQAIVDNPPDTCFKHYQQGQVLARRSDRPLLTKEETPGLNAAELELLKAEHEHHLAIEHEQNPIRKWMRFTSRAMIVLLLTGLLCTYIVYYAPNIVADNMRGIKLAVLLLIMLGLVRIMGFLPNINPHAMVLIVCTTGIILTIAYDQRFALAVGSITTAFVVFQIRGNFPILVVMLTGLMSMVFQLREIRTRSKLLVVAGISAVIVFLVNWALAIRAGMYWRMAIVDCLWAAGSALLAGLIVQGILPAIERIFGVATGSTLLEWCDASKPLLKRLAMESPGTYNHSLQLGAMCEAAADTIGARGLLARVGAYYHDIGKINKPEYFTENQSEENKHEKLNPAMSVLIILGHVKDGLEMARKYNLPVALREFIATHHGTTLVQYFYHAASQQSESDKAPAPDESQFRYPGPKPHSKEPAILMLADAAESSVRAMKEPTPARIRTQVHKVVTSRLEDGQLDDCELTLREVHQIEDSLVKSLCGMYHGRIAYPSKESPAEKTGNGHPENGEKENAQPEEK